MTANSIVYEFATLFAVVDPIGGVPIFLALVGDRPTREFRTIALRAVIVAALVLLTFLVIGRFVLDALGVSIHSFRIAGGLILFLIGLQMLFTSTDPSSSVKSGVSADARDIAVFPLAIPMIAGPGSMMTVVILAGETGASILSHVVTGVVLLVVLGSQLVLLWFAPAILRVMGRGGVQVLTRVMGVLLAALAVEAVITGVRAAFAVGVTAAAGAAS